ncbi:MAG: bacteriohemerythrin [Planctomycetota bacterium]|nr:bacteriohemerythrin [Planctomycetota bacterium]
MTLFIWNSSYELGIPAIDRQHQGLVHTINELHDAMMAGQDRDVTVRVILRLINYTKVHFDAEEQLLLSKGYPAYSDHRQSHHVFVKRVLDFHNQYLDGRVVLSAEVLTFLKDWLTHHIFEEDRAYAQWLREHGFLEAGESRASAH